MQLWFVSIYVYICLYFFSDLGNMIYTIYLFFVVFVTMKELFITINFIEMYVQKLNDIYM